MKSGGQHHSALQRLRGLSRNDIRLSRLGYSIPAFPIIKPITSVIIAIAWMLCFMCEAQVDELTVQTNKHWHLLSKFPSDAQISRLASGNAIWIVSVKNRWAWTTNADEFWHGVWAEGTNGIRVQLRFATNTTEFTVHVEVGTFTFKIPRGSQCFSAPNGKFVRFELLDSKHRIVPIKPDAGTNLFNSIGVYYKTNASVWALPSGESLVADFPERISRNEWSLFYRGVGAAPHVVLRDYGSPAEINKINLYDLFAITEAGDYTLTVQPVLYLQDSFESAFLHRLDLPSVTSKVHLLSQLQKR